MDVRLSAIKSVRNGHLKNQRITLEQFCTARGLANVASSDFMRMTLRGGTSA